MIGWFRRACCAVVVMQFLSGGVVAQDFDTVLKQAVSDAKDVYTDPRVFAQVIPSPDDFDSLRCCPARA